MTLKEHALVPLFEKFISYSYKGKRLKTDGSRIKPQTVHNYKYVLAYLQEYEQEYDIKLRIKTGLGNNKRSFDAEKKYWKKFYQQFTSYLYQKKDCYDNYVGNVIKTIRIFFNFLNREMGINTGVFYKDFYVCREEVPIVTLMPEQLQFLVNDLDFEKQLSPSLQKTKDIFVFGSTVALRVSDLFAIKFTDVEKLGDSYYLPVKTIKTGTRVRIKLPDYAIAIIQKFKKTGKKRKSIFPPIPLTRFNSQLKQIAEQAGWTEVVNKERTKRGVAVKKASLSNNNLLRFCDVISSHTMRRTAITTMLMLGMKEHVVRKISGHADNSKSFYRYVNLVQSYLDNEVDQVFGKLALGA